MADKILTPDEQILRMPECIKCFDELRERGDSVFGTFEVNSKAALLDFETKTKNMFISLKEESTAYYKDREKKSDEFYDNQVEKYDRLESKLVGMVKWTLGIVLFIVAIYGGIVAASYTMVQDKADKNNVLSLKDAYTIRVLGDKYYDQRYVLKDGENVDKSTYEWHMSYIFETLSRGESIKSLPIRALPLPEPDNKLKK